MYMCIYMYIYIYIYRERERERERLRCTTAMLIAAAQGLPLLLAMRTLRISYCLPRGSQTSNLFFSYRLPALTVEGTQL